MIEITLSQWNTVGKTLGSNASTSQGALGRLHQHLSRDEGNRAVAPAWGGQLRLLKGSFLFFLSPFSFYSMRSFAISLYINGLHSVNTQWILMKTNCDRSMSP